MRVGEIYEQFEKPRINVHKRLGSTYFTGACIHAKLAITLQSPDLDRSTRGPGLGPGSEIISCEQRGTKHRCSIGRGLPFKR